MKFKTVGSGPFNQWRPVRPAYMERFKDRAWRLFGIKVPPELRPEIRARFERRKKEWNRKKYGGLIGSVLRKHEKAFTDLVVKDFILFDVLKNREPERLGMVVPFKRSPDEILPLIRRPLFELSKNMIVDPEIFSKPIFVGVAEFPLMEQLMSEYKSREGPDHMIDALRYGMMVHERQARKTRLQRAWAWISKILQGGRRWVSTVKMRIQGKRD